MITDLSTVKSALGITDASRDSEITRLISVASSVIEKYTKQVFDKDAEYTEILPGNGTHYLVLKAFPVNSITSVEYNNNTIGNPSWSTMDSDWYSVLEDSGVS